MLTLSIFKVIFGANSKFANSNNKYPGMIHASISYKVDFPNNEVIVIIMKKKGISYINLITYDIPKLFIEILFYPLAIDVCSISLLEHKRLELKDILRNRLG